MAHKIKRELISSNLKDYGYGRTEKNVRKVTYRWFTFQETWYRYHEFASEDEPDYDEYWSDCTCLDTEELIGEDDVNYDKDIINYVEWILNK